MQTDIGEIAAAASAATTCAQRRPPSSRAMRPVTDHCDALRERSKKAQPDERWSEEDQRNPGDQNGVNGG